MNRNHLHAMTPRVLGEASEIQFGGYRAWKTETIGSRLEITLPSDDTEKGSVSFWMLPLEELSYRYDIADRQKKHPGTDHKNVILLGDHADLENVRESCFALIWDSGWYPQLWAKCFKGHLYHTGFYPELQLNCLAGHFSFQRLQWYHLCLNWNQAANYLEIFVNGISVARSYVESKLKSGKIASTLYCGFPHLAYADFSFSPAPRSAEALQQEVCARTACIPPQLSQQLDGMFNGTLQRQRQALPPGIESLPWQESLSLDLCNAEHLKEFYVQGNTDAVSIKDDGMHVHTPLERTRPRRPGEEDKVQLYLWTERMFEGNLWVSYEFCPLQEGGLSLLLTQATGLKGEDFLAEYPRRTDGSMRMVCWENIRNYHWEYYREVDDVYPGSSSHAFVKNPWITPLSYRLFPRQPLDKGTWHRLDWIQIDDRLLGFINGQNIFDVQDCGDNGSGPVHRSGHIAIRCMYGSDIIFRNLVVKNVPPAWRRI